MSRYMQIDIRLNPFFEKPFEKTFPNLAHFLRQRSYKELVEKDPSLYHLTDPLVMIAESPNTPADIKERLRPYVMKLDSLKEQAREHLLARHLNELDRLLYQMEDVFEDLEGAL
ncbi:MAG: hypothetical protein ACQEQ7_15205 [Thermodesulfobacteriota bacterium]